MHPITQATVDALNAKYAGLGPQAVLHGLIEEEFPGVVTLVTSFGTESAVLIHMASQIDRGLDVVFVNTGKLFGETLRYKNDLIVKLGLANVRTVMPKPALLDANDPKGALWASNADRCCFVRKVEPLTRALKDVNVWISGRKGFHGGGRASLAMFELVDGRIKVNPLTNWGKAELDAYFVAHDLPRHPLEADGYPSVGCMPCTSRVEAGEDLRAGRWRGLAKDECGIHVPIRRLGQSRIAS